MCQPTDAPPYPHPSHVTASGPGHATGLDRTPADPPHPGCSVCWDPTAAEDARINARTPRDDRNEPEE